MVKPWKGAILVPIALFLGTITSSPIITIIRLPGQWLLGWCGCQRWSIVVQQAKQLSICFLGDQPLWAMVFNGCLSSVKRCIVETHRTQRNYSHIAKRTQNLLPQTFVLSCTDYWGDDLRENESFDRGHEEGDKEAKEQVGQDGQKHFWKEVVKCIDTFVFSLFAKYLF